MVANLNIKVCGMRNPDNIRKLIHLYPDYIGFIFYPKSKRFIHEIQAPRILDIIPPRIKKVGVFVNEVQANIVQLAYLFQLDYIQLHGNELPEYCREFSDVGLKVIKAFGVSEEFDFSITDEYADACDYFLFDTKVDDYGGSGKQFNWQILKEYKGTKPFFLSGGIGAKDVQAIKELDISGLFAIDVNSRFETEPAIKNIELLSEFFNELKDKTNLPDAGV